MTNSGSRALALAAPPAPPAVGPIVVSDHITEILSDSGEGAQTAGQILGATSARMGNCIWTVEIIPAEIEPPARSREGASGCRVRISSNPVTNMGDEAQVVVALNEQVLFGRLAQGAYKKGTLLLLENKWADSPIEQIRQDYAAARAEFEGVHGLVVRDVPMEQECLKLIKDPRKGKNSWVVGLLTALLGRDLDVVLEEVTRSLKRKGPEVVNQNVALVRAGHVWGTANLPRRYEIPALPTTQRMVAMNGNQAIALGAMAAGFEVCSMYPITPATSAPHHLAQNFKEVGGVVHQAEDEIAAAGFAIGASYAGKTALTVTSGPGMALKTEMLGLAIMDEIPLVVVDVQRGGPSTGLPTKVEQGDLLSALYGQPGDAPKIVLAPSTVAECFHFMTLARKLAESFRTPVIVLSDANLATALTLFPRPIAQDEWLAPPVDQSPWPQGKRPFDWDDKTGLSARPIPGQKDGCYVLTSLAHDERSRVAYQPEANERGCKMRSLKLASLRRTLQPPPVHGDPTGDLLVVGWGSTRGAIEEAVDRLRARGGRVSSLHLTFLSPLEPGLKEIFSKFLKVMTVEINYSDDPVDVPGDGRRMAQLAWILRAQTLVDIDCYSRIMGQPLPPALIEQELERRLAARGGATCSA